MCVIRWFLLKSCIFGMYISVTDASVSLKTFDGEKAYLKDSTVTLVCSITPYNNEMTWFVDNDIYADCFLGTCGPSANKPYTFKFTFDETAGIFNLTIDSVNSSHAQLVFACDDGNGRETINFTVTTDNGQNHSSTSNTSNSQTKPDINNQTTVNIPIGNGAGPCGTLCIVLICVGSFLLLIIFLVIIMHYCVQPKFTWIELEDTQIHLYWTDSLNCCCQKIFGYRIVRYPIKGQVRDNHCRQEFTHEKHCTLKKLDPMAVYEISLCRTLCCLKSLATKRYVITRKSGMRNDQGYHAKSKSIEVGWTQPDCITNPQLKYKVTCNEEVMKNEYGNTDIKIEYLNPSEMYKIEVFAIDDGKDSLLLAKMISTTAFQQEPFPEDPLGNVHQNDSDQNH